MDDFSIAQIEYAEWLYSRLQSIRAVAKKMGCTDAKVQKLLVEANIGPYRERNRRVQEMARAGMTIQEIADELGIRKNYVYQFLPYRKNVAGNPHPEKYLTRYMRKWRAKKKD